MNNLIRDARRIGVPEPRMTLSITPIPLEVPDRGRPLELRITAPIRGTNLPILLLSHGMGPSLYIASKDGYGPLANFYAEHGFAVVQPTHATSRVGGLDETAPGAPLFWRSRVNDMTAIIDRLGEIEAMVPELAGRMDHGKIGIIGHSMGGQTAAMLLGARLTDPKDETAQNVDLADRRISAGVLLAAPGRGDALSAYAAENYSALNPDYTHLTTRTLVVAGDADNNPHLNTRGPDWHLDAYRDSPGSDSLLLLKGGKHGLGGIAGYDAKETDDEDPERLAITQRMSWAYLWSALNDDGSVWDQARMDLETHCAPHARVECK